MQITNILEKDFSNNNLVSEKEQKNFLETTLGKVVNMGLNTGIRVLLPDLIEEQVINIKDALIKNGFKAGVKEAINSAVDFGKSAIGLVTGNFENVNQARNAIKSGGLIDSISNIFDTSVNNSIESNLISNNIGKILKSGKNVILNSIESNIENNFQSQLSTLEKLSKYNENWNECYKKQDFNGMQREYEKIKNSLKILLPTEETITTARKIENLHVLIKNKGGDFNLSNEEIELANRLIK